MWMKRLLSGGGSRTQIFPIMCAVLCRLGDCGGHPPIHLLRYSCTCTTRLALGPAPLAAMVAGGERAFTARHRVVHQLSSRHLANKPSYATSWHQSCHT